MNFDDQLKELVKKLLDLALLSGTKIASAESCTGGLISGLITQIAGSSKMFDRGFVTYSNEAKMQNLGVLKKTLDEFGAVSQQVAEEMAIGAIKNSNANLSIAVTGIAGPISDDTNKPVGLVFISSLNDLNQNLIVEKFQFDGNRSEVRNAAITNALKILIFQLSQ
ncbi:MAG: nicotinamide-nucleotide amidase [Rickettsiales bacterium]|jgi:nicotinamide-nucleotide amidase